MKFKGLKRLLVDYLKLNGGWVHSGELERAQWVNPRTGRPYKPSTASRTLRDLAEVHPGEQPVLLVKYEPTAEYMYNTGSEPKKMEVKIEMRDGRPVAILS